MTNLSANRGSIMQPATIENRDVDAADRRSTCCPPGYANAERDRRSVVDAPHRDGMSAIPQKITPTSLLLKSRIHAAGIPVVHELARGVPGFWGPPASEVADLYSVLTAVQS